jgi:glycosyltransferase 2 family protein
MLAGFPIALGLVQTSRDAALLGLVLATAGGALGSILLFARFPLPAAVIQRWSLLRKVNTLSGYVRELVAPTMDGAAAWSAALAQHLLRVGVLASLAAGLGLGIPTTTLFAFTPAALLAAMAPISFGGWGVREAAFVYFLGSAAISGEAALSLSIAFGFLRMIVGAIGGVVWALADKDRYRIDTPST